MVERKEIYCAEGTIDSCGVSINEVTSTLPEKEQVKYDESIRKSYESLVISLRCRREVIPFQAKFYEPELPKPNGRSLNPDLFA